MSGAAQCAKSASPGGQTTRPARADREYAAMGDRGVRLDGAPAAVKRRLSTCVGSNLPLHRIRRDVSNAEGDSQGSPEQAVRGLVPLRVPRETGDILEIGAQWSIATRDIPSFERYMAQLKCYYLDYQNDLPESAYKYQLLGLNLLCLLAQNRVAEFHTELELLPAKEIQSNVYISHPVSMEQFLMEGSYNKVFLSKGNVPSPSYTFFTDILLDTVRDEIASCVEKAYERISGPDVTRMLFLEAPRQTAAYATKRGWTQASNTYQFSTEVKHTDDVIPTEDLAAQTIGYARELEMIV
uniref:26S proteasome non-ATPase regulatory subunit 8 n=1 Tax=Ixodes ricinus TaxID=34613 RepID=A0A0K8REV4_IXORI